MTGYKPKTLIIEVSTSQTRNEKYDKNCYALTVLTFVLKYNIQRQF